MTDRKPIAYRLEPVYPPSGLSMGTACMMYCMVTGETLSGSGGGGDYVSPAVYEKLKSGQMVSPPVEQMIDEELANIEGKVQGLPDKIKVAKQGMDRRDDALRMIRPYAEAIAAWEREHGTAALVMDHEKNDFVKRMMKAALTGSARGALAAMDGAAYK